MMNAKSKSEREEDGKPRVDWDEAEVAAEITQRIPAAAETEPSAETGQQTEAACDCCRPIYDKVERDENGLIKRDGFRMKGVNYGPEFDEENLNRALKFVVGSAIFFLLLVVIGVVVLCKYIL